MFLSAVCFSFTSLIHSHTSDNLACFVLYVQLGFFSPRCLFRPTYSVRFFLIASSTPQQKTHTHIGCDIQVEHLVFICYRHHISALEEEPTIFLSTTAETIFYIFFGSSFFSYLWKFPQIETRRMRERSTCNRYFVFFSSCVEHPKENFQLASQLHTFSPKSYHNMRRKRAIKLEYEPNRTNEWMSTNSEERMSKRREKNKPKEMRWKKTHITHTLDTIEKQNN